MERMGLPKAEILELQEETIKLEESVQIKGKLRTEKLAKFYKVKAGLLEFEERLEEAKEYFAKSVEIYKENGLEQ